MTKLLRDRLASGLVLALTLGAVVFLSQKESWTHVPAGLARQGFGYLVGALFGSSISLWRSGRWLDPGSWGTEDIKNAPRVRIYSRISTIGHAVLYTIGFALIILGL